MPNINCDIERLAFWLPDSRADGGIRRVHLARDFVQMERKLAGVCMRLKVPLTAYSGVVLTCEQKLQRNFYRIALAHRDPDLSVTLHHTLATPELADLWQNWARFFSKPALYAEQGDVAIRRAQARRPRTVHVAKRRPSIRSRRRSGWRLSKLVRPAHELFSRE